MKILTFKLLFILVLEIILTSSGDVPRAVKLNNLNFISFNNFGKFKLVPIVRVDRLMCNSSLNLAENFTCKLKLESTHRCRLNLSLSFKEPMMQLFVSFKTYRYQKFKTESVIIFLREISWSNTGHF